MTIRGNKWAILSDSSLPEDKFLYIGSEKEWRQLESEILDKDQINTNQQKQNNKTMKIENNPTAFPYRCTDSLDAWLDKYLYNDMDQEQAGLAAASFKKHLNENYDWSDAEFSYKDDVLWKEENNSYTTELNYAGIKKENIKITTKDGYIYIKADGRDGTLEEEHLIVPTWADTDKIAAKLEDGILTVSMPKIEEAKPKEIVIS